MEALDMVVKFIDCPKYCFFCGSLMDHMIPSICALGGSYGS